MRILIAILTLSSLTLSAPATAQVAPAGACITEQEVVAAQEAWGDGIVEIGRVHQEGGDYAQAAADHINRFYGYDLSLVLFKPTLAAEEQFRISFDGALSYFVGGNSFYAEDAGFALRPWTAVRWQNSGIVNNSCNMAVAMGNYIFTATDGTDTKVEYTLGYVRDDNGDLRIVVHHSALPYPGA
jgi:hypothetical protein